MDEHALDERIERSATLPGRCYADRDAFERQKDTLFARSWQWIGSAADAPAPGQATPLTLLPDFLDEPLVLARDEDGTLAAFSNVCTHRAKIVLEAPGPLRSLVCRYHGRRFGADGRCLAAPGFERVPDVPGPRDDLPRVALGELFGHLFVSLDPEVDFDTWSAPLRERFAHLSIADFTHDPTRDRAFDVAAHWALYVDNYLEGFHIPTVHPELARTLSADDYRTEVFGHGSVQTGYARAGETAFEPGLGRSAAEERPVGGYYAWLFPSTMFNLYPWGLSLNVVQPLTTERTRVVYRGYVGKPELTGQGAGGALDLVEQQDEDVVESVARGVRSRLYRHGRFAPEQEAGVHHFHRRLANYFPRPT